MPSSHLILCYPLLLLPPIPPSIRVFSNLSLRLLLKVIHFNFTTVLVDILSFLVSLKWKWLPEEALQMATERREMKSIKFCNYYTGKQISWKHQFLARMWSNGSFCMLQVGVFIGRIALENGLWLSHKVDATHILWPSILPQSICSLAVVFTL